MSKAVKILKHSDRPNKAGDYVRLLCLSGADKGKAFYIVGPRVILGRAETADIRVMDIKSSREHAEIVKVTGDYLVTDLNSQNGVMVNDLKIKQEKLKEGDRIIIGQTIYVFEKIKIEAPIETKLEDLHSDPNEKDKVPEKMPMRLIIIAVVAIAILFLTMDDGAEIQKSDKSKTRLKDPSLGAPILESMKKQKEMNAETKQRMNTYIQNGLREFREENYFRAMSEFNNALTWVPNDPLAQFYLRKTKEALDKTIESYFQIAKRDEEAIKYQKAIVSYCSIIRLLYNYPEHPNYKNAQKGIESMEDKLGMQRGEVKCIETIKNEG